MAVTYSCSCSCALHNAPPPHTMPPMMEEPISRVPRPPGTRAIDKARAAAAAVPFRNDQCMAGPPSCSASDFKTPRLRRCPFDLTTINWNSSSRLGGGLDGYVWKVWFGADGPYALKVVSIPGACVGNQRLLIHFFLSSGTQNRLSSPTTSPSRENVRTPPFSR